MDSKPTKSVGHFEENKFPVGGHQFLLECCPKLIKTYNHGQNAVNKSQFKNKNEQFCALGCLFSKLPRLFVNFPSSIVVIFYRVNRSNIKVFSYADEKITLKKAPVDPDSTHPYLILVCLALEKSLNPYYFMR